MADYDIVTHRPPRVEIDDDVPTGSPANFVRVRGVDLREVAHRTAAARADHPGADVLVDIDVMIAHDARSAREALAASGFDERAETLRYVGTPAGLAGLVADIHALGIADGAILRPLLPGALELIRSHVLPELRTMGPMDPFPQASQPA